MGRPNLVHRLARHLTPARLQARAHRARVDDAGHGYDRFGLERESVSAMLGLLAPLYDHWFRVTSHGAEHIPAVGPAILAANHSGTLPLDAMMLWNDVIRHTEPPRVPRITMDHFVGLLPFVGALFARAGGVGGSRGNMHALLDAGELVGVFPEGVPGIGKPFAERYRLQPWRGGHVELAIRHRAPIVPVAIIGAEEQMPQIARLPIRAFGSPYLPIVASPIPLPVHYHIHYGPPIDLVAEGAADANDPSAVQAGAQRVRDAVAALLAGGLAARRGIFS